MSSDATARLSERDPIPPVLPSLSSLQMQVDVLQTRLNTCQSRFFNLVDAVSHIIGIADLTGSLVYLNQQWQHYTGLELTDSLGQGFLLALPPDDRDRFWSEWTQALSTQTQFITDVQLRNTDGQYQWFQLQAQSVLGVDGTVQEWTMTFSNLQHCNQTEAEFHGDPEFMKALLANLSDGIVACNADGVLTLFNRAAQRLHGFPLQPAPPEQWAEYYDLYYSDGQTPIELADIPLWRALQGESVQDVELMVVPKQGSPKTVLVSGDAIVNAQGQLLGAVVAARDITKRKQAEAALQELNMDLEARVQARMQELTESHEALQQEVETRIRAEAQLAEQNEVLLRQNQELQEQRERIQRQNQQLLETSRLKSQFLAMMSHELRTPMNAIIGFSQLLLRQRHSSLSPQQANMVERILNNGKKLLGMLNEVLDFSRLEAGRLQLRSKEFDLAQLVTATLDELRSLSEEKKLTLESQICLANPNITNDSMRVRQILVNLIANAIKFTEKGHVCVRVWELEDDRVAIAVEDTGIGIEAQSLDIIFQPFRQTDQTTRRRYSGTGLGLAITHSLVQMMQGKISVTSTVGEGSTFQVEVARSVSPPESH